MRFSTFALAAAAAMTFASAPAQAALAVGAQAPDFTTQASLAGKPFRFTLAQALKRGPVVLYFFPAAFTSGCTIEANQFAAATDDFRAAGATVIGVSADDIETLNRFSVQECRNKFAVASASPAMIEAYDVKLPQREGLSNRTSYVIAPDGKVAFVHSAMSPAGHVGGTLEAVRTLQQRERR